MQKIYTIQNRELLYRLKSKLEAENISCLIKNEDPSGLAAGEITPIIAWPELWIINDCQFEQAQLMIEKELMRLSAARKKSWKCPQCGEILEGQFEACWNCGTGKK